MDLTPLNGLLLRTPQLELRPPTPESVEALYEVAATGIHPPEEMPFGVAWTDTLTRESFVEFHQSLLTTWTPARWNCHFISFVGGRPVGTQEIQATDFSARREVHTGSWIGAAHQGLGYGTEQRAAVLEFGFRGLGAGAASTGALIDNIASQRVSTKLGYRTIGEGTLSPRGEPVRHLDYRLERDDWHCPIPVAIEGLEPCLPLFGAN